MSAVDCREEFAVICKTRIEIPGGKGRCLRLLYGAEVDAIDSSEYYMYIMIYALNIFICSFV